MSDQTDHIVERRVPTSADLALLIRVLRQASEWTQETLAELSGLTVRTIQRVEKGDPSSLDTRRALARGFGYDDLEVFNKPWPMLDPEKLKAQSEELERTTVVVHVTRVERSSGMRKMVEGAESSVCEELGTVSQEARKAFAYLVDNLRDYNDVRDCYSEHDKLGFDESLQSFLDTIAEQKAAVGVGERCVKVRFKSEGEAVSWRNMYFILAPLDGLPSQVRVPKAFEIG